VRRPEAEMGFPLVVVIANRSSVRYVASCDLSRCLPAPAAFCLWWQRLPSSCMICTRVWRWMVRWVGHRSTPSPFP